MNIKNYISKSLELLLIPVFLGSCTISKVGKYEISYFVRGDDYISNCLNSSSQTYMVKASCKEITTASLNLRNDTIFVNILVDKNGDGNLDSKIGGYRIINSNPGKKDVILSKFLPITDADREEYKCIYEHIRPILDIKEFERKQ
jgi:hypothetical protein